MTNEHNTNYIADALQNIQIKSSQNIGIDIRYRETATMLISSLINKYAPNQDSGTLTKKTTEFLTNIVMSDYDGKLKNEQILSGKNDKLFLPQPGMLKHWAEKHGFEQIATQNNNVYTKDASDKYILTYYPPLSQSFAERTTNDIKDTTNKHWYSHTKSTIYDSYGHPISSINPEAFYNDTTHDATKYVPHDSYSYAVDYKKLGLEKEDIINGFKYQNAGINVMDPKIQQSIFRLQNSGLSCENIIKLWENQIDIKNENNISLIENSLKQNNNDNDIYKLNLEKSKNEYKYNLQDYSCAIQPTAPILFATEAKINRSKLDNIQAQKTREDIGLYNIYDNNNYNKINQDFYNSYKQNTMSNFKNAVNEDVKNIINHPMESIKDIGEKLFSSVTWTVSKTMQWLPQAYNIAINKIKQTINTEEIANAFGISIDDKKSKNICSKDIADAFNQTPIKPKNNETEDNLYKHIPINHQQRA